MLSTTLYVNKKKQPKFESLWHCQILIISSTSLPGIANKIKKQLTVSAEAVGRITSAVSVLHPDLLQGRRRLPTDGPRRRARVHLAHYPAVRDLLHTHHHLDATQPAGLA